VGVAIAVRPITGTESRCPRRDREQVSGGHKEPGHVAYGNRPPSTLYFASARPHI